jgi:hypothetical protein
MVAVQLSQQQQPHHCYGTGEIDDGRISAACSLARGIKASARTRQENAARLKGLLTWSFA